VSTTDTTTDIDTLSVHTIRGLCVDEVQKANSGHPGRVAEAARQ
jgi:transketolase